MDLGRVPTDGLEQQLLEDEQLIGRLPARQMAILSELDTRQIATADGSRSLSEWAAGRLDVGIESARTLVRTTRLQDRPDLHAELAEGSLSFDRVEALSRLPENIGHMEWADVGGVRREAAKRAKVSAKPRLGVHPTGFW